ncbi:peptidylprolyl isomerase [Peribacillus alkalitolerans]|uniref:peptidylprolyl isomerase n=1 Tax=Peribacillus alkalitolerans TaxID=1550385 RepID=UPI0013D7DD6C|nr:peptidylprolyl isomerase [Peribacillus alkalitolerans]
MKKSLVLLLISIMLVLTACGTSKDEAKKQEKPTVTEEKKDDSTQGNEGETAGDYPQFKEIKADEKVVLMETSMGDIKIKLFPKMAPKAVENFVTHAEKGYYDGVSFHRVIKDFMVQGGDPQGTGMGGESIWGAPFEDEFSMQLYNFRGALSMANSGPGTNGSQFFIVQASKVDEGLQDQMLKAGYPEEVVKLYAKHGGTPWLDQKHTVFGQVVEGMDVVDSMANVETAEADKPVEDIIIKKINIIQ